MRLFSAKMLGLALGWVHFLSQGMSLKASRRYTSLKDSISYFFMRTHSTA